MVRRARPAASARPLPHDQPVWRAAGNSVPMAVYRHV